MRRGHLVAFRRVMTGPLGRASGLPKGMLGPATHGLRWSARRSAGSPCQPPPAQAVDPGPRQNAGGPRQTMCRPIRGSDQAAGDSTWMTRLAINSLVLAP